jgi:hypothetical protein
MLLAGQYVGVLSGRWGVMQNLLLEWSERGPEFDPDKDPQQITHLFKLDQRRQIEDGTRDNVVRMGTLVHLARDLEPWIDEKVTAGLFSKPVYRQPSWLVKHFLEQGVLSCWFGDFGAYKSFVALDLACHVALGLSEWRDFPLKVTGPVYYLAGEGHSGIARRVRGFEKKHEVSILDDPNVPFYVSSHGLELDVDASWQQLKTAMAAHPPALVVVDTLATNLAGDENSTQDINAFYRGLRHAITVPYNATCIFISHIGHKAQDRPKGARQILGNADASTELASPEPNRSALLCRKMKDGGDPKPFALTLEEIEIDRDEDNEAITTLVIDRRQAAMAALTEEQNAIVTYLRGHPGATQREVQEHALGEPDSDGKKAGRRCDVLAKLQYLRSEGQGRHKRWHPVIDDLTEIFKDPVED